MFRQLARWLQDQDGGSDNTAFAKAAMRIFSLHPAQLERFLEEVWWARAQLGTNETWELAVPPTQHMLDCELNSGLDEVLAYPADDIYPVRPPEPPQVLRGADIVWDHLIYAYMVENTRILEIFAKVLYDLLHGERLEVPDAPTQRWMRATEELLFRDAPPFAVTSISSQLRPDTRATRRNAYYRLFGMDLNHGTLDNRPYPYEKPAIANRDFVRTFEEFTREVWRGIENSGNTSGPNATDVSAIANLARSLQDMLKARRGSDLGILSREEYAAVATMSWFHLTIAFDESPVVKHLNAKASSPDERLRKIGERVGIPAHSRSHNYLQLATSMSRILRQVEAGSFSTPDAASVLFREVAGMTNPVRTDMQTVITHWSIATGRDLKAGKVTVTPRSADAGQVAAVRNGRVTREAGSLASTLANAQPYLPS